MPEKTVDCGAAIFRFWLISDYSLCFIALTEYMLWILRIAHDFIALQITFLDFFLFKCLSASHKSVWRPYRKKGLLAAIKTCHLRKGMERNGIRRKRKCKKREDNGHFYNNL
jgi:hypothetical protein